LRLLLLCANKQWYDFYVCCLLGLIKSLLSTDMSSLLTARGQVDPNIRFLKALATTTVYTPTGTVSSNMPSASFSAATATSTYASGTIFRDMGKRTVTYNTSNQNVAQYILVQPQIGAATEGVPANYATQKFYVQVWAAATAATAVTVGRVG
jgi:hypothetical protein